ncbi:MAG: DUF1549 domain-containing protein [Planctomycetaceae bacterium]
MLVFFRCLIAPFRRGCDVRGIACRLMWLVCVAFIAIGLVSIAQAAKKSSAKKKKTPQRINSQESSQSLKKASEKLAMLEKIHQSFPPKKSGASVAYQSADLDRELKLRIGEAESAYAPLISDEGFLRRASFDLTGQPPEPDDIKEFVANTSASKRAKKIDELLGSSEYAQHWGHYWRTAVMHNAPGKKKGLNPQALEDWFADEFEQNTGWDRIVCELLAATPKRPKKGDENGAQNYGPNNFALAFENEPEELAAQTARLFMGINIQCAECHDHPFDKWKREQFHELAAFFSAKPYFMPGADDPSRKTEIHAKFLLGEVPPKYIDTPDGRRVAVAAYLVYNPDNHWFARAFVNRIWNELLGDGFYSVDSLGPDKECHYQPVINRLASVFRSKDFNVKWLFRTIMNSQAYQRESRTLGSSDRLFTAVRPSRLRPDQVAASLENVVDTLGKASRSVAIAFDADLSMPQDLLEGSIQQVLLLMNNDTLQKGLSNSELKQKLIAIKDDEELLNELYLGVVARKATDPELSRGRSYLQRASSRSDAVDDLIWVLVNSTEFVTKK